MNMIIDDSVKSTPHTLEVQASERYFVTLANTYTLRWLCGTCETIGNDQPVGDKRWRCHVFTSQVEKKWWRRMSSSLDRLIAYFHREVGSLPPSTVRILRHHIAARAERDPSDVDLLFQLFLSDTVVIQRLHVNLIVLLGTGKFKFPNIKILVSYEYSLCQDLLDLCLPMLPNLTVLKAVAADKLSTLRVIRDHAKNLETLSLPRLHISVAENDSMCRMFFHGTPLSAVTKRFSEGELLPLSFPKLRHLAIPFRFPTCLPFFRMLVFHYPKCHFEWEFIKDDATPVSLFDAILCPAISLNPDHQQRHCELRYEDLRFSYVDEVLTKWANLESLLLVIGAASASIDHQHTLSKLRAILGNCKKLQKLQICAIQNHEPCLKTVISVCEQYGRKIKALCLMDYGSALSHVQMVALLNCFPNVSSLTLVCSHRNTFNEDSIKVTFLPNVKTIRILIKDTPISLNSLRRFSLFVRVIMKQCPNVTDLTLPMDSIFLAMLDELKIESQLCSLTIHLCSAFVNTSFVLQLCEYIRTSSVKDFIVRQLSNAEQMPSDSRPSQLSDELPFNAAELLSELIALCGVPVKRHDPKLGVTLW